MNKNKKIAMAVIATVMAGTMALPLAACKPEETKGTSQEKLSYTTDANGNLSYAATTTLKFDIGDDDKRTPSFKNGKLLSGDVKLPDGKEYNTDSLKPAWQAMQDKLNFKLEAPFLNKSEKIKNYEGTTGGLGSVDLLTDSTPTIVSKSLENISTFLDLSLYLDVMPNYKAFLESNPMVYMSLVSDTQTGAMYYAPYFDGNDDIEKYVLTKTNWVSSLLDQDLTEAPADDTTWIAQAKAKGLSLQDKDKNDYAEAYAESFMGTTGSYTVATTDTTDKAKTVTLKVNYDAAKADLAKTEAGSLGALVKAAIGDKTVKTESGNIVDILNQMITDTKGAVTGQQMLAVVQRYVDVVYQTEAGAKFYTKRSHVFNAINAGWDVDLLTALSRCLVTNPKLIKSGSAGNTVGGANATTLGNLYAIQAREDKANRYADLYAFAGELYGARGLESRYEFSYIDNNGNLQDARAQEYTYTALDKMNKLKKEGLLYIGSNVGKISFYKEGNVESMMEHEYVNTQTPAGFQLMKDAQGKPLATGNAIEEGYRFEPIVTPVSKWDVNGDGTAETVMRFTESWRSVKNSGFAIPYDAVKGNPDKLAAILKFVDYLFSHDGQIAMSYGPMAEDATGTNGFWYNEEYDASKHEAGQYFEYEGKKYYSKTYYAGAWQPTLTSNTLNAYYGKAVHDVTYDGNGAFGASCVRSYTNFARYVIGSALVLGNKLQSFEYQATSQMGIDGANVVDANLQNGCIKHVTMTVDSNNWWYTIVPSAVPLTTQQATYINNNCYSLNQVAFTGSSSDKTNYFVNIVANGLSKSSPKVSGYACFDTAAECITMLNNYLNLDTYVAYKQMGWNQLKTYYTDVVAPKLG